MSGTCLSTHCAMYSANVKIVYFFRFSCLEVAKSLFPGKTSCDVIYGRPAQTVEEWHMELSRVKRAVPPLIFLDFERSFVTITDMKCKFIRTHAH